VRILSLDPGYANLGIAIVEVDRSKRGLKAIRAIPHSESIRVGNAIQPMSFSRRLLPALKQLDKDWGPFDAVAMETPPFIMRRVKVRCLIWHVMGVVSCWAAYEGIPIRHRSPIQLKKTACQVLRREFDSKNIPKKADIRKVVDKLGHKPRPTSHENDAVLAAYACFGA